MFINICMHLVVNADFSLSPGWLCPYLEWLFFLVENIFQEIPPQNGAWLAYSNFLPRKMRERVILLRNYYMLFSENHFCAVQFKTWSVREHFLLMFFSPVLFVPLHCGHIGMFVLFSCTGTEYALELPVSIRCCREGYSKASCSTWLLVLKLHVLAMLRDFFFHLWQLVRRVFAWKLWSRERELACFKAFNRVIFMLRVGEPCCKSCNLLWEGQ